jgi:hypothetical protein
MPRRTKVLVGLQDLLVHRCGTPVDIEVIFQDRVTPRSSMRVYTIHERLRGRKDFPMRAVCHRKNNTTVGAGCTHTTRLESDCSCTCSLGNVGSISVGSAMWPVVRGTPSSTTVPLPLASSLLSPSLLAVTCEHQGECAHGFQRRGTRGRCREAVSGAREQRRGLTPHCHTRKHKRGKAHRAHPASVAPREDPLVGW